MKLEGTPVIRAALRPAMKQPPRPRPVQIRLASTGPGPGPQGEAGKEGGGSNKNLAYK